MTQEFFKVTKKTGKSSDIGKQARQIAFDCPVPRQDLCKVLHITHFRKQGCKFEYFQYNI